MIGLAYLLGGLLSYKIMFHRIHQQSLRCWPALHRTRNGDLRERRSDSQEAALYSAVWPIALPLVLWETRKSNDEVYTG